MARRRCASSPTATRLPLAAARRDGFPDTVKQGGELYDRHCMICHGLNVVAGPIPISGTHRRRRTRSSSRSCAAARARHLGCRRSVICSACDQAKAIQQYVLSRAHESATARRNSVLN